MEFQGIIGELQEYVVVGDGNLMPSESTIIPKKGVEVTTERPGSSDSADYKWAPNATKLLIDLYGIYRKKVGTLEVKSVKIMWLKIVEELCIKYNIRVTASNCINRWKVLERNYKKFVDNKTGRGRKYFEYENEMDNLFGKKRNIHPEILLHNTEVDNNLDDRNKTLEKTGNFEENIVPEGNVLNETPAASQQVQVECETPSRTSQKRSRITKRKAKITSLEAMRLDRQVYYNEILGIERQKLEEIKKRNNLIEERNVILKNCKCHNSLL